MIKDTWYQVDDGPDGSLNVRIDTRARRISFESDPVNDMIYADWEVEGAKALDAMVARISAASVNAFLSEKPYTMYLTSVPDD